MPYIDRDAFIKQQRELYCKDCTRRMGVKNGKLKEIYKIGEAPCKSCELNDALDSLDDYPEADVAPVVHGHWYFTEYEYFTCSVCGKSYYNGCESSEETRSRLENRDVFDFCPHCGAKMDDGRGGKRKW